MNFWQWFPGTVIFALNELYTPFFLLSTLSPCFMRPRPLGGSVKDTWLDLGEGVGVGGGERWRGRVESRVRWLLRGWKLCLPGTLRFNCQTAAPFQSASTLLALCNESSLRTPGVVKAWIRNRNPSEYIAANSHPAKWNPHTPAFPSF